MNGVKVVFPVKAYPSQVAMASKIITSLQRSQNALLVSLSSSQSNSYLDTGRNLPPGQARPWPCCALPWPGRRRSRPSAMSSTNCWREPRPARTRSSGRGCSAWPPVRGWSGRRRRRQLRYHKPRPQGEDSSPQGMMRSPQSTIIFRSPARLTRIGHQTC